MAAQARYPVHVSAAGLTRQPIEIESAVYFTCVEALQNVLKHAGGATVWVELSEAPGRLHFEVRDDGCGFTRDDHDGRGLRNMRDRIEAIGGHLTIASKRGQGTRVSGSVQMA